MGLVNTALQIGRSAITSYQSALSVIGNNIANAADPDYTRQRAVLDPVQGAPLVEGIQPGGGVALTSLQRVINEGLENRWREAISDMESAKIESQILSQIETAFNELTDNDLSSMMSSLFNSFQDVQNDPTDLGLRSVAIGNARALADVFRTRREGFLSLVDEVNQQIDAVTKQANELAGQIAELNVKIVEAEANGHVAGALRDSRDAVLRELSEIMEITVRSQESGTVSVFVGNETLVQLGESRGLTTQVVVGDDFVRYEVRFADNNGQTDIRGGQLAGLITARDTHIVVMVAELDQFAAGLIEAVNEVHTNGQGSEGYTTVTGTYGVSDPTLALNDPSNGLAFVPQSGSFFIGVTDTTSGLTETHQINLDLDGLGGDDTSLNDLVAQINANVPEVTAVVAVNNKLSLSVQNGFTMTFGHDGAMARDDTSNVLAALGVNTFFEGKDASDIAVNNVVAARSEFLAASNANHIGDGSNAGLLGAAGETAGTTLDNMNLYDFYNRMVGELGITTAAAGAKFESTDGVRVALQQQRASISGVNVDEEAIDLIRYQRAFQGSARFTSIIDQLITEMLNIVR